MKKIKFLLPVLIIVFYSCKKDPAQIFSSESKITGFSFRMTDNPGITIDYNAQIVNDTILIAIPEAWPTTLLPRISLSDGAKLNTDVVQKDFSQPVNYVVIAENGETRKYVTKLGGLATPALPHLQINGAVVSFDSLSNTFYFPVLPGKSLKGYQLTFDTLSAAYVKINGERLTYNAKAQTPLRTNDEITIAAADVFNVQAEYKLLITGLPIVQLTGDPNIGDLDKELNFSLVDPEYEIHGSTFFTQSPTRIRLRGGTSRSYPKKNYHLNLRDEAGEKNEANILGLRTDQKWILDAMYIDQSKMRNRICTDLWNSMNNVPHINKEPDALNGTRGYLTEVFINDEYRGVYMLTEKVDRKQLKVKKKTGYVYKAEGWTNAVQFISAAPYDNLIEAWDGWEIKYPDADDDRPINWGPLSDFVKFVSESTNEEFVQEVSDRVNIDNVIDFILFTNAVEAEDNDAKNTFFSVYDTTQSVQFFYSVWDLDATLGRTWNGKTKDNNFRFYATNNRLFRKLLALNPDNFIDRLKSRWNELKNNELLPSRLEALIDHYKQQLTETHAAEREAEKWPGSIADPETEATLMKSYYQNHIQQLDAYINSLNSL